MGPQRLRSVAWRVRYHRHLYRIRFIAGGLGALVVVLGAAAVAIASVHYVTDHSPPENGMLKDDARWERGMNLTAFLPDAYAGPTAERAMLTARSVGTRRVAIVPTWYMDGIASDSVYSDPAKTPTDASIEAAATKARSLGLSVVLKPHVDVRDGTFRGDIMPGDTGAWFDSYGQMIENYAALAQRIDADVFVIGTELTSMSLYPDDWRDLIGRVRSVYDGKVTFAANWVDGAENIEFWNDLDFIGIDAYMPLQTTDPANPTMDELLTAWGPYVARMAQLNARWHRRIIFTELGYQSRVGTAARIEGDQPVSQPAQAQAYEAAFTALSPQSWFDGIWWWDWSAEGLVEPDGWSAEDKEAQQVLYDWQGSGAGNASVTVPPGGGVG